MTKRPPSTHWNLIILPSGRVININRIISHAPGGPYWYMAGGTGGEDYFGSIYLDEADNLALERYLAQRATVIDQDGDIVGSSE